MKRNVYFIIPLVLAALVSFSQRPTMELTFTAVDSAAWQQLDSIKVMNRTQGGDTVLYYPDTVLVLEYTLGIPENRQELQRLTITAVYPNPTTDHSTITFQLPASGQVSIIATDILGRVAASTERSLRQGQHSFRFVPGGQGIYLVQVRWNGQTKSVKVQSTAPGRQSMAALYYLGSGLTEPGQKNVKVIEGFRFSLGDDLLYIGYVDTLESGMLDSPSKNQTYTFRFAYNIPCPGTPTVTYEEQVYNTVQIFSQCWLKENLNVGVMINGTKEQKNNGTVEKYCYENDTNNCDKYGGLYQWNEIMQYSYYQQGPQGICPPGWHIPTDQEWKLLEGVVDSQYGIGDNAWDIDGYRGYDAGTNLKASSGWNEDGNGTDLFGFSGQAGGIRNETFGNQGNQGGWWTSTGIIDNFYNWYAWCRFLSYDLLGVGRYGFSKPTGLSVRCIRDEL